MIEESLRYAPMGGFEDGLPWIAVSDVQIGDAQIRDGDLVYVISRAARPEAENLDFTRTAAPAHLGFGYGIHHCIGAPLARADMLIAVTSLLRRFSGLRLGIAPDEIGWTSWQADPPDREASCQLGRLRT